MIDSPDFAKEIEETLKSEQCECDPKPAEEPLKHRPSDAGKCRRQIYISKTGKGDIDDLPLGRFKTGSMIHEWLENNLNLDGDYSYEKDVSGTIGNVQFSGRADLIDESRNIIYDFKTKRSTEDEDCDPPYDYHIDQLMIYMLLHGSNHAKLIYISRDDLSAVEYPQDDFINIDGERINEVIDKMRDVSMEIIKNGVKEAIPFESCDCYLCYQEQYDVN